MRSHIRLWQSLRQYVRRNQPAYHSLRTPPPISAIPTTAARTDGIVQSLGCDGIPTASQISRSCASNEAALLSACSHIHAFPLFQYHLLLTCGYLFAVVALDAIRG